MSTGLTTFLIFLNLIIFLMTGFPVAYSLIAISIIWYLILQGPFMLQVIPATIFETATTEIFIAAPLFIFMAICLERTGVGTLLYSAIYKWTGGVSGGLAAGTLVAATLIAAMTGIGGTAVLVLGVLAVPEMIRRNYDVRLALGGLPPGGALGVLIPPTVIGVLLGGFAGIPIGSLFFGAALPGIVIAALFCGYVLALCALKPSLAPRIPYDERPSLGEKIRSLVHVAPPTILIAVVLGSIWFGVATPSEAAGIGALGTLVLAALRGQLRAVPEVLKYSGQVSVMVLTLLVGGALFSRLLQLSGAAQLIAGAMVGIDVGVIATLLIFIGIATLLGMFMDGAAIIFIVVPIMMPVITALGIDPVWFGVMLMIAIAAGYVTPPFGMNLFYLKGIVEQVKNEPGCEALKSVSLFDIWMACLPYVAIIYICLGLVILFPSLATWLPAQMR